MHAPKNLSFNSPLYSIVVSLQNRRNFWALSSEQKRARGAHLVLRARLQNAKITPVLQAISGQLRLHDDLAISPLVVVRDLDKEQVKWWLQLTVNILALLLQMVNFKWLTIFSIVVKHVLPV